jgi:hypothetical protein
MPKEYSTSALLFLADDGQSGFTSEPSDQRVFHTTADWVLIIRLRL